VYDLNAVDTDPSVYVGEYVHTDSPYGIYVHKGTYSFESDPDNVDFRVTVEDSSTSGGVRDALDLDSYGNSADPFWGPGPLGWIYIRFRDNTETALDDDSLLTDAPDLPSWADKHSLTIWGTSFDYRIEATLTWIGTGQPPTGVSPGDVHQFSLEQNYPNTFNPSTAIAYSIARAENVDLRIYAVDGRLVRTLVDEHQKSNSYRVHWDGRNNTGGSVASGVYFYRLIAGDFKATKKMVLIR
jgi:hypothetical protein